MRAAVARRKAPGIPDADAEIAAAVWAAIGRGVTDQRVLFNRAQDAAVAARRYERRHRRRPPGIFHEQLDPADRAVDAADAALTIRRLLSELPAPSSDVINWADHKVGVGSGVRLSSREKMAGARWAARARVVLGAPDDVA